VWSQSGLSPTVLHGLPHHASRKVPILNGRILLDEGPFWPNGASEPRTPLLSCAASPEAATGITMTPVSVSAYEDPRRLGEVGTSMPVSSRCIRSSTAPRTSTISDATQWHSSNDTASTAAAR